MGNLKKNIEFSKMKKQTNEQKKKTGVVGDFFSILLRTKKLGYIFSLNFLNFFFSLGISEMSCTFLSHRES